MRRHGGIPALWLPGEPRGELEEAMAKTGRAHVPSTSDAAVKAKTGKDWAGWFGVLDKGGAAKLDHKAIAHMLSESMAYPAGGARW